MIEVTAAVISKRRRDKQNGDEKLKNLNGIFGSKIHTTGGEAVGPADVYNGSYFLN